MRVYIVRHGKASREPQYADDAERPLLERGRSDVEKIAKHLAEAGIDVHQIRHSGLLRAQQTAEIFGAHLNPPGGVIAVKGLRYTDPVDVLARELEHESEPVMLVGHNPFMENLVAMLLGISVERTPVWFGTSSTVSMEYLPMSSEWTLRWALHRELYR